MKFSWLVVVGLGAVLLASGCSPTDSLNSATQNQPQKNTTQTETTNTTNTTSKSTQSTANPGPWPEVNWVLTNSLMKQENWGTEYNLNLAMNHWLSGKKYSYADWHLPPKWKPYLFKNEHYITQKSGPALLNNPTLFITLQGTVYERFGVAGRFWGVPAADDIPADATIVAEFVPLKPAVEAGIIPVYYSYPQVDSIYYVEPEVLKILGMTRKEYDADTEQKN